MKIAIACEGNQVAQHFGHCESFTIIDVEGQNIVGTESIPNPGHKPGFLPVFLYELGVQVVVSGGMGGGAISLFAERGMQVIVGASGMVPEIATAFLQGTLQSTDEVCSQHEHAADASCSH